MPVLQYEKDETIAKLLFVIHCDLNHMDRLVDNIITNPASNIIYIKELTNILNQQLKIAKIVEQELAGSQKNTNKTINKSFLGA